MASFTKQKSPLFVIGGVVVLAALAFYFMRPTGHEENGSPPAPERTARNAKRTGIRTDAVAEVRDPSGALKADFRVEIASTEETRTQGLMGREFLAPDEGMLFLFDDAEERAFWMANTPLPLDIVFIDARHVIVKIYRNTTPYSEQSLPSETPAMYTLEVNGGACGMNGIAEGDRVTWESASAAR